MKPDFDSAPTPFITAGDRVQQRGQAEPQILSAFLKCTCCLCKAINSPFASHLPLQHHCYCNVMLTHANGNTGGAFCEMRPSSPSSFISPGLEDQWQQQSRSGSALQKGFFTLCPSLNCCVSCHWSKTLNFQATVKNVINNLRWYYRKHWLPR